MSTSRKQQMDEMIAELKSIDNCPWCSAVLLPGDNSSFKFWRCGSSVGVSSGDPIRTRECEMRENTFGAH